MTKTFMERYDDAKDKEGLRKESFQYFNDKYFKEPFTNYWIIEQTERFKAKQLRFFMPGRIYTYQYMPHGTDVLDFYDKRPMVYIIGEYISKSTGMHIVQGINLNFLPEKAKAQFIDTAYRIFGDAYKVADEMSDEDRLASMQAINNLVTNWFFMASNFDKNANIGLAFAVRNYDITRIKTPVLIEVEDFEMVPYFVPRELVGKAVAFVYQLYMKSRMKILERSAISNKNSNKALQAQKKYKKPGG
jgi:hypothetical protein